MTLVPVILCGGSGTRLWPLSRAGYPKQLLALTGPKSLLQETVDRLAPLKPAPGAPVVVCNEAHRFLVEGQLREAGYASTIILEPAGRNTAPAVAVAAAVARQQAGEDAVLLVLPADHVIRDRAALAAAVSAALPAAQAGSLVTFGVVPDRPETGYGYIQADVAGREPAPGVRPVRRFVEKPDFETARRYVQSGDYLWNSGMFLLGAAAYLEELARHAPDIATAAGKAAAGLVTEGSFRKLDAELFNACRSESIDYAVMEKTERAAVVPLDAGWSDVGSFAALHEVSDQDAQGNAIAGDVVALDCRGSYIRAGHRLVAVTGLEDCVVVETADAVLVAPRNRSQDVKKIVEALEAKQRPEARLGREVFRPWGSYDSLGQGEGFQVKRLTVLPGAVLSLQMHHRRAEHWVVVAGRARITRDDEVFDLERGQHTFIPLGAKHRIENPGPGILHIVEVQVGDYLGEDDIVRFEDRYGRQGRTD
jgi:mannose-1-phosphate guanylyltransferase/mannose-6-phosphate isomerase